MQLNNRIILYLVNTVHLNLTNSFQETFFHHLRLGQTSCPLLQVRTHTELKSLLSLQIMPYWWDLSFSLALAADVVLGYVTWTLCYSHWVPWPGFTFTRQAWQHHTHISSARPPVLGSVEHSFCLAGTLAAGASHSVTLSSETHELEIDCIPSACSFMQNSGPKLHPNIMAPVVRRHCACEIGLNCGFWLSDVFQFIGRPFKEKINFLQMWLW